MSLSGRVVFITGASRGIGKEIAKACASRGARVVVAAKSVAESAKLPGTVQETAREIIEAGGEALPLPLDVRDDVACEAAIAQTIERWGRVDVLINNAGALYWHDIVDTPMKKFDLVMGVNVRGSFALTRAALPHMIKARWGHVLMMSPPFDVHAAAHRAAYAVSKLGMTLVAQGVADEGAAHNVTGSSLWPATLIESQATINWGLGTRELWRKADILVDATLAIISREPSARPGRSWIDEDVLRDEGVTDFSRYACVPGTDPPRVTWRDEMAAG